MSLLNVCGLSFRYPSGPALFKDLSFSINPSDRVSIVGPNGSGKSTLLRILAGELEPTTGHIARRRDLSIAVADQEARPVTGESLFDFVFAANSRLARLRHAIRQLEDGLSGGSSAGLYATRLDEYQEQGGFAAEAGVQRTLAGIGFDAGDYDTPMSDLSGGERTRALLARALSAQPGLLILDEPTNHLDIAAREWLARKLSASESAVVATSHDRAFLRSFARRTIEIARGEARIFDTGYDEYRSARAVIEQQAWSAYEAFGRRKRAIESAAQRRSELAARMVIAPAGVRHGNDHYGRIAAKVDRTARILRERVSGERAVAKPWEEQSISELSFDPAPRGSDVVLVVRGIAKSFGSKTLFRDLDFHLRRGDRMAIVGPNGSGKTTLLNVIAGVTEPDSGEIALGANVEVATMTQDFGDLDRSPLEICGDDVRARTLLACLKVRPECMNRPAGELSGGERTKVALARMLNSRANLLLLDEPTNHLEIEAQEALEQALLRYPGAFVLVSHDRAFLDALDVERLELGRME